MKWKIVKIYPPGDNCPSSLELIGTDDPDWDEPEWEAVVKWDGCVDIRRHYRNIDDKTVDSDYLHICELGDFIRGMQKLKKIARDTMPCWEGE